MRPRERATRLQPNFSRAYVQAMRPRGLFTHSCLSASRGACPIRHFSAEPNVDADDARRQISVTVVLDQQKQFRVGDVVVDGLDAKTESIRRSMIKPGDVFRYENVDQFLKANRSVLPPDASPDDFRLTEKNVKYGTVSM